LKLNLNDLLDASTSTNILKVLGDSGDTVNALGFVKMASTKTENGMSMAVPSCLPKTTYALPSLFESSLTLIIKSSKPSPLTSPALD
jgi:hypothetical protein